MLNLATELFAHKDKMVEIIATKIGTNGVAGLNVSEHRTSVGAPKMSAAAFIFDLLEATKISAYESTVGNSVYVEITNDDGSVTSAIADGESIRFSDNRGQMHHRYNIIPEIVYQLSKFGKNTEMQKIFREKGSMMGMTSTGPIRDKLYQFCDSYYFGIAKDKGRIDDDNSLLQEEVEAAFRSGTYEPCASIVEYYTMQGMKMPESANTKLATKKPRKRAVKKTEENFVQECKDGKYRVAYEWPEALKKFIIKPSFLDTFEVTPEFKEIVQKISYRSKKILERMDMGMTGAEAIGKDALNIMLLGKPGTGKTTLAYALSAATGMPVCTTAWNKHSDEDEVEGKTKIVDGKPSFVETNALLFHEFGGIDVNEEINLADPSVTMGSLGQKLEYPFIVKKNGYETVVRHPLNVVIATMNVGTNGSNPLNQALANRFKTPYILDDPTRETFIGILEKASGKNREVCEWVYGAYEATTQYLKDPDVNEDEICQNLSIRTCLGAIENMEEGQEPVRALVNSIVGAVAVVDVEVARRLEREKIACLPNPMFEF